MKYKQGYMENDRLNDFRELRYELLNEKKENPWLSFLVAMALVAFVYLLPIAAQAYGIIN